MRVLQTNIFKKVVKKLYPNQKQDLDKAIGIIIDESLIGVEKLGDLKGVKVYKFRMINQLNVVSL